MDKIKRVPIILSETGIRLTIGKFFVRDVIKSTIVFEMVRQEGL